MCNKIITRCSGQRKNNSRCRKTKNMEGIYYCFIHAHQENNPKQLIPLTCSGTKKDDKRCSNKGWTSKGAHFLCRHHTLNALHSENIPEYELHSENIPEYEFDVENNTNNIIKPSTSIQKLKYSVMKIRCLGFTKLFERCKNYKNKDGQYLCKHHADDTWLMSCVYRCSGMIKNNGITHRCRNEKNADKKFYCDNHLC
uniref:Uncharacterized protein n=1 Tax=Pithovirus LCPAC102 TaxID=2506587 RepID=A0A4D5XF81_9VIRU|nr:MAG: hypothetical protein LCPAC102_01650 [Pithovirus LCPAC102]